MGVYHTFAIFYRLNGAQLLPAAMHGLWVHGGKTMGNYINSLFYFGFGRRNQQNQVLTYVSVGETSRPLQRVVRIGK